MTYKLDNIYYCYCELIDLALLTKKLSLKFLESPKLDLVAMILAKHLLQKYS